MGSLNSDAVTLGKVTARAEAAMAVGLRALREVKEERRNLREDRVKCGREEFQ